MNAFAAATRLNRFSSHLNRNQTFRLTAHPAEKTHFSAFALYPNANSIPYLLNQKVKP